MEITPEIQALETRIKQLDEKRMGLSATAGPLILEMGRKEHQPDVEALVDVLTQLSAVSDEQIQAMGEHFIVGMKHAVQTAVPMAMKAQREALGYR